jgi:hypothetical protein
MLRGNRLVAGIAVLGVALFLMEPGAVVCNAQAVADSRMYLHKDWQLQSACVVKAKGEEISKAGFDASKWHKTDVPTTVVGALIADKTFPDPNYGTNLRDFPGMNYSNKSLFANQDFPKGSPFACAWWFRTEFRLPEGDRERNRWLHFIGINYRANIWVNGQKIADADNVAGTYRSYEFDVTKSLTPGKVNSLAVEVSAPRKNDLGITWVDWNPTPPDKNMGIWKEVFLTVSGPVSLRNPFVASQVSTDLKSAALTVEADVRNASGGEVKGTLRAKLAGVSVSQPVTLAAGETKTVRFAPDNFAELKLENPRLWWPYTIGEPYLQEAKLTFETGGEASDTASTTFGIRQVTSELTSDGHRLFKINGRSILIRGAAWAPDLFFRWSSERVATDLAYVKDMGMNAIRLEGRLDREELYERRTAQGCERIVEEPDTNLTKASERIRVAERERQSAAGGGRESVSGDREGARLAESGSVVGERNGDYSDREIRCEDDWPLRIRASGVLAGGSALRRRAWLQHRDQPGACDSSSREPREVHSEGAFVADRRGVELPRGRRAVYHRKCVYRRIDAAVRSADIARRLFAKVAGDDLRRRARDVRSVCAKQIQIDGRDSMDAQQRMAFADLASLRLLSGAGGRIFWHQESLRAGTRAVFLR